MRPTFILAVLLVIASCGSRKSSIKMGQTTRADLIAEKGDDFKEVETPVKDTRVLVFNNDEKYQLKGDIVVNSFKNPQGDAKLLLFWKHRFKDCKTLSKNLPKEPGSHTPPEIELSCPSEGIAVIYTEGSDSVSRVVEYEIK